MKGLYMSVELLTYIVFLLTHYLEHLQIHFIINYLNVLLKEHSMFKIYLYLLSLPKLRNLHKN